MSWLRSSPLRSSFTKQRSRDSPPKDADPVACYDSFRKHWQQSHDIILNSLPPKSIPCQDDVLGIVNHVDQMITLLLLELRDYSLRQRHQIQRLQQKNIVVAAQLNSQCFPCLEFLLSENLLDTLYRWSIHTGRFQDAVRLEQLKLYELLVSHDSSLLAHEPVTRPLLNLLDACVDDIMPLEVQRKLVTLLNHVCVALVQNTELLGLFFRPASGKNRFIPFSLLIPYIHREGGVGQQARDAMLLCMSLSKNNDEIGNYIAKESHICSLLATGLSGLYSVLPRTLDIETPDWHRLIVDDINDLPSLTQLMNSLEFCNAVAQVVHPLVQEQLLEFIYRGFLVPVIGPALLQTTVEELVAATAYFDLFLRSVTEPGLLRPLIKFLLEENYDDNRILDHLIRRISSQIPRLSMVTLALFETLVDLNCEDVMLELCLGALAPCSHVMLSQRRNLLHELDPFGRCAEKFLSLTPNCCSVCGIYGGKSATDVPTPAAVPPSPNTIHNSNFAVYQSLGNNNTKAPPIGESLYNNYYAYLRDARQKIASCQQACEKWSRKYQNTEYQEANDYDIWDEDAAEDTDDDVKAKYNDDDYDENENCNETNGSTSPNSQLFGRLDQRQNNDATKSQKLERVIRRSSTDEKVDKILASFTGKIKLSGQDHKQQRQEKRQEQGQESSEFENVTNKLGPAERERLEADIAALLSEVVDEPRQAKFQSDDLKSPTFNTGDLSAASNSLQLSLSGAESSGYESYAPCKSSNESTPLNEDYDECTEPTTSTDRLFPNSQSMSESLHLSPKNKLTNKVQSKKRNGMPKNDHVVHLNWKERQQIAAEVDTRPPSVGIFLDILLKKLEYMTENSVYVNLHLTGLISRLAIYPQPLLQSFLLNHSLVFQPSIKSLFQVLASLKHKIDGYLSKQQPDVVSVLTEHAKIFLINRENRLVNARKNILEAAAQVPSPKKQYGAGDHESLAVVPVREPKRRSLTSSLTQMFKKSTNSLEMHNVPTESTDSNDSFSLISEEGSKEKDGNLKARLSNWNSWESPNVINRLQNVVLCAVILGEWLKELAAITQEHTIVSWFNAAAAIDHFELTS
ncbi:FHIP family protein AGAP011705 isoform X2 [Phymastichus coffea]|uniref:FHIP family protein AGAP011705 isoform X2 n=1 Tax=Phymastichus coffea TaxID=108790 RepID=UPI00273C47CB|nr:FHIP family protein AGAP011705 isoform X2 [Phymastichus coffea]